MTTTANGTEAREYSLRVHGHLDDHWGTWLGDLALDRRADGTTTLTGAVADQAQLHGLLIRIRDMGATLLELHALPIAGAEIQPVLTHPVRTERLTLRPGTEQDVERTFPYRRLASVGEWLTELPTDLERYRASFTEPARLAATVIVERDGQVVGDFMLRVEDAWAQKEVAELARGTQAEIGWVLDPAYTGQGYATEAVRALLRVAFTDLGVRRVVANAFADNTASRRLMERVGMRCEAYTVQDSLHRSGQWLDGVSYALLIDEWESGTAAGGSANDGGLRP